MLPGHALSSTAIKGAYLAPDFLPVGLVDFELGGIGISDPSKGLRVQVWKLEYAGGSVYLSSANTPATPLFQRPDITEIGLAFDQNMRPFVCFVQQGAAYYWWFDTLTSQQIFTALPAGSRTPRACIDDKRPLQAASSDIILAYMRDDKLYFRAQRDRYTIEYLLAEGLEADLDRIGMTDKNRIQFRMIPHV